MSGRRERIRITPNMAHMGFVPVNVPKGSRRSHMLRPKPTIQGRTPFIPAFPEYDLAFAIGELAPVEWQALEWIVTYADIIKVEGVTPHLLVPVSYEMIDVLAQFGAAAEDRENDLEDEHEPHGLNGDEGDYSG